MKRRAFLRSASAMAVPVILPVGSFMAMPKMNLFSGVSDDSDKILILIQLHGGNDGLHTVIPRDQYAGLSASRPNFVLPENSILPISDTLGFHPSMTEMKELYDTERLNIIQSVAYPNQNRSHFRSLDIWNTASDADEVLSTGWIGRRLDDTVDGYPEGYPNEEFPDPFALTVGFVLSETCQGNLANYSLAVNSDQTINDVGGGPANSPSDGTFYSYELDFLYNAVGQANAYGNALNDAFAAGQNLATYPEGNRLANQMSLVAKLIHGGLKTKVYVVTLGGFDNHADQLDLADKTTGTHANLLKTLSDAISAFQTDIEMMDLQERVVGMTYSEFGRQIKSNLSTGTDHGTAAPLFLFGSCVQPGVFGDNVEITGEEDPGAGVPMQYDFRSIYGTVLVDWFGAEDSDVRTYLYPDFQHLPILKDCKAVVANEEPALLDPVFSVYPNPATDYIKIEFDLLSKAHVRVSLFDIMGRENIVATSQSMNKGIHTITMETRELPTGTYYVRVQADAVQKVKSVLVI